MYDWPEVQWAHDALWAAIARRLAALGVKAPATLERERPAEEVWLDPGLVLSQTCGWPYSTRLRDKVRIVATPVYEVEGCDGPLYSSTIVTRHDERAKSLSDFQGRRFAVNTSDSLSGYVALAAALREAGVDPSGIEWVDTGSHRASVRAVADGQADGAAIDAVCWALAEQYEGEAVRGLSVLCRTPLKPGLPLITAGSRSDDELVLLQGVLQEALASEETREARNALSLSGTAFVADSDYLAISALR
jgi:ABC-type phosphate/phosphonate transport system substrate-binding protein